MKLSLQLLSSLLLWLLMSCIIVLIVLLPRDIEVHRDVNQRDIMSYHFTWSSYKKNIIGYYEDVRENKSLGTAVNQQPVEKELVHYGVRSIKILIPAFLISIIIGILKGVFDYRHNRGVWKILGEGTTWFGQSIPDFFVILLIELLVSLTIHRMFPSIPIYGYNHWYNCILPIIFLAMYPASVIANYTTQALKEEDAQDYILTAKAKGIPESDILWKHILRNCSAKIMLHFMPIILTLLSSMFIVELLTLYRGMGTRLMEAIHVKLKLASTDTVIPIEMPTVIGFSLGFLFLLLLAQWANQILRFLIIPIRKEDN